MYEHWSDICKHRVSLKITISDFYSSVTQLQALKDWLDELVEWQPNQYQWVVRLNGTIDIWFANPEHAVICSLIWS